MRPGRFIVVGAGLAGLSAAVTLAGRGAQVELIEGAAQAGGRCRSYFDPQLGLKIDNGNHFVFSGNRAVCEYLETIGGEAGLVGPETNAYAFVDLRTGERWSLKPNMGVIPWWVASPGRRVPGTRVADYLPLAKLMRAPAGAKVGETISCSGTLYERLLEPILVGALNTDPAGASAELASAVVRESLGRGGSAYRPRVAHPTLAAVFVDPALAYLESRGGVVSLGRRVRGLESADGRATALSVAGERVALGPEDRVVVALPPWAATDLLPGITAPDAFSAIVNGHFHITPPARWLGDEPVRMVGVIGATVQWIFLFPDRISITVSGADRLVDREREDLARLFWSEVAQALEIDPALPPWQVVKERRATFAATPEQNARRPGPVTALSNVWLAGDWTATGLPATLEGSVRSGRRAAELALG